MQTAGVQLEKVADEVIAFGSGRGSEADSSSGRRAGDVGRGGNELEQIEGNIFVAAGQVGRLIHRIPPIEMVAGGRRTAAMA